MNISPVQVLAKQVIQNSLGLGRQEKVLIDVTGHAEELANALISATYDVGARPFVRFRPIHSIKALVEGIDEQHLEMWLEQDRSMQNAMDAYIGIRADDNIYEMSDIPADQYTRYQTGYLQPMQESMARLGRWILLRSPTSSMAQLAKMSDLACEQVYYKACNLNYERFSLLTRPLSNRLREADRVRILGPGSDLSFSIGNMPHMVCDGKYNLPDGEMFTAPHADSAEGIITFNTIATYQGISFEQIQLTFHQGKVVKASCEGENATHRLRKLLETDEGASRIGEFGLGLNPQIITPMGNPLFDEKMAGSVHIALGQAYPMADNGNESNLHWDLVLSQTAASGGGELYFDEELIRKDGLFVPMDLQPLNTWRGD